VKPTQSLTIILALNSYINRIMNFVLCKKFICFCRKSCLWRSTFHSWSVNTFIARYLNCQLVEFCVEGKHGINGPMDVFSFKN